MPEAARSTLESLWGGTEMDFSGNELRVGFVRGSELGGDTGVSFVRRSLRGRIQPDRGGWQSVRHRGGGADRDRDPPVRPRSEPFRSGSRSGWTSAPGLASSAVR